ncbi:MAG TPA: RNA 2',3'-cyclic phosphodiesterase [Verrucomicrobiae bacterium]|nr:RNA 2',3'-cyclic phosphodiesterase [Verrucomicrobiae bacterium]
MVYRLFVAIELPPDLRRSLHRVGGDLKEGRRVPEEQLHLTLRFVGEADDDGFGRLVEELAKVRGVSFPLTVQGTGCFPSPQRARVVWAGTAEQPLLACLQQEIELAVRRAGFAAEPKKFTAHLTLARLREPAPSAVRSFLEGSASLALPSFTVDAFHLFSSRLSPKGATHRVERSFTLLNPAEL